MGIITVLRPFLNSPGERIAELFSKRHANCPTDHERSAAEVIAFYAAPVLQGGSEPDIEVFGLHYMDSAGKGFSHGVPGHADRLVQWTFNKPRGCSSQLVWIA